MSDPKLYRVRARDYGSLARRFSGLLIYSLLMGVPFCASIFFIYRLLTWVQIPEAQLLRAMLKLVWVPFGTLVFVVTRGIYIWDFEIMSDYVVCYARGTSRRFERTRDRVLPETSRFTWFGRARGLVIGDRWKGFAFLPMTSSDYAEVRAKLVNWQGT